jgi:thymidylate synthase (FAD)
MTTVEYLRHSGDDLAVVNAARVSFDAESDWDDNGLATDPAFDMEPMLSHRDEKLIHYLAKHKHKSPFNHAFASFRVTAPIFVARQLVKHEYLPWNEVSRRYVEGDLEWYWPEEGDWRSQPDNVKQGSGGPLDMETTHDICAGYQELIRVAENLYYNSIERGLCREQARMFLPQSLMTTWVWSGSVYAFAKMCALRVDSHAQREAAYVAQPIQDTLKALYPVTMEALIQHGAD